ncbi:neuronal membrane glycoprotein M6-a isoform X1 [Neodiprion virginianus]|uniref:Neuronal membrane glycoprotein M6-a isoform X1 n=1 Tax=Neodiprion lecontei TaxID=441921 RepID=A0A6J0C3A8_NEOLC|nr:neuronal membrane glycoprotein M6-a isoform X1 [Neodiprion lecontei]XP_046432059.1 neuronal membrane glycoprotein M6-a isoform X1 [Neodiprion fabricii]XP_046624273.1 neuronal membrane glycoprotein M6-a isoform X1 [Neodiprion virginianus]
MAQQWRRNRGTEEASVAVPLNKKRFNSAISLDRYSDHNVHDRYEINDETRNMCNDIMARVPYATLIATIMCCLGVGIFCGTMYRGATLASLMLDQVFHQRLVWLEAVQLIFAIVGASMAALGFMILCVGCLATGATRHRVYRAWRSRVGGRISCAVFMTITYILQLGWLLIFAFLVITTLIFSIFWGMCSHPRVQSLDQCIDFTQFDFLFPNNTRVEDMKVCGSQEVKLFCKDYVEKAEVMFILATVASLLVVLSLIHYLMCLSANYAHIRDHEKFQELQELQYLQDPDIDSPQPPLGSAHAKNRY